MEGYEECPSKGGWSPSFKKRSVFKLSFKEGMKDKIQRRDGELSSKGAMKDRPKSRGTIFFRLHRSWESYCLLNELVSTKRFFYNIYYEKC